MVRSSLRRRAMRNVWEGVVHPLGGRSGRPDIGLADVTARDGSRSAGDGGRPNQLSSDSR